MLQKQLNVGGICGFEFIKKSTDHLVTLWICGKT